MSTFLFKHHPTNKKYHEQENMCLTSSWKPRACPHPIQVSSENTLSLININIKLQSVYDCKNHEPEIEAPELFESKLNILHRDMRGVRG